MADHDLIIIGGGAAGLTAAIYACRAGIDTLLLERLMPGGQIINADRIENFPGFPDGVSGAELGPLMQRQATQFGLQIRLAEVDDLALHAGEWRVSAYGERIAARAVIIAGGSTLRKLGVPGEEELYGAGVSYCATCDGGFFQNQTVAVVGGGDSALDEALVLTEYAAKVILFHRGESLSAERILQDRVLAHPKIELHASASVTAILGETQVQAIAVENAQSGETSRQDIDGVFIYVGLDPNTAYLSELLPLDAGGHIPVDIRMRTALPGLFAAGDIRQHSAAQLAASVGDGATAAISARRYLESL